MMRESMMLISFEGGSTIHGLKREAPLGARPWTAAQTAIW